MSHFYANIQGSRGEATRQGTKNSGMFGHVRGWDIGGRVEMFYNINLDRDEVRIYVTTGSNGGGREEYLGVFWNDNGKIVKG